MTEFRYKARDSAGASRSGTVEAASRSSAASELRGRGLIVVGVEAIATRTDSKKRFDFGRLLSIRSIDVELSLQQLSMMVRGGMPLLTALVSLVEQAPRKSLAVVWREVIQKIQTGSSLSKAMSSHRCFPDFIIQLIRVGERTGELSPVLNRSVQTLRNRRQSFQKVSSALIYPVLVCGVAIGVTVYMIVYLVPRLEVYLQNLGKKMPAMTQFLIDTSAWMRQYYSMIAILICGIAVFSLVLYRSTEGRMWCDRFALRIPLLGRLFKLCETSTFARSLSVMLGSGITLIDGLGTVEKLLYNRFTAKTVNDTRNSIIQGGNFADAIDEGKAFSPMLNRMIAVGQQSGDLKTVLEEVADFHEDQFEASIQRLNALLTPILTLGIGAIVGYVYIAFFVALLAAGS